MSFTTINFIVFVAIVLIIYYIVSGNYQWFVLLAASGIFYCVYDWKSVFFIIISSISVYISARIIDKVETKGKKQLWLILGVGVNLIILLCMKYSGFLAKIPFIGYPFQAWSQSIIKPINLIIPLGISFYTLALLGYLIDVYRGKYKAENNLGYILLFTSYFPHILQGPIARYNTFISQFRKGNKIRFSYDRFKNAVQLVTWGYMKKLIIADRAAIFVDAVYQDCYGKGGTTLFVASILYSIQIYADFSGCVDIALGVSELFGISLIDNFKQPYFSNSINDFWKRWHISLSSWFRDYLYIPLGGNRKGTFRRWLNVLIVFVVSGFWHGAGWNYIVWGSLHGIYQIIGYWLKPLKDRVYQLTNLDHSGILGLGKIIMTFLLVNFAWIFFRLTNLRQAMYVVKTILLHWSLWDLLDGSLYQYGLSAKGLGLLFVFIIILAIVDYLHWKGIHIREIISKQILPVRWFIYITAFFSIVILGIYGIGYDANAFIYMQF